jgi:hypothetical protein
VFDAITLTRIDRFWDNLWVAGHLVIVGTCILLMNRYDEVNVHGEDPARAEFWLVNIMQFFFGGLLSTYLVFYFRSGTIAASWPFLLVLAAAFIANESLKRHYTRLVFQISLFFLSLFAFAIFIVPVALHAIGTSVFILSGIISLVVMGAFLAVIKYSSRERFRRSQWLLRFIIIGIFAGVNLLYFYNFIPPIPLSLKEGGIYHSLTVNAPGHYTVTSENQGWFNFFHFSETVNLVNSDPLYAYSAVFSPTALDTNIVHEWQYYDPAKEAWMTMAHVTLPVVGGNDNGYRTYSMIDAPAAGAWRVNVETPHGAIIGTMRFDVVATSTEPTLETGQID